MGRTWSLGGKRWGKFLWEKWDELTSEEKEEIEDRYEENLTLSGFSRINGLFLNKPNKRR